MALRDKLTSIGTITLDVYALNLRDSPNLARFAYLKFADCVATVVDDDDKRELGTIGGVVGAHYEITLNRDGGSENEGVLILDRSDVWDQVNKLFDSDVAQIIIRNLREQCQRKWDDEQAAYLIKRELDERTRLLAELAKLEERERELNDGISGIDGTPPASGGEAQAG